MSPLDPASSRLLAELGRVDVIVADNLERGRLMRARIRKLRRALEAGKPLGDLVTSEHRPLLVELLAANIEALHDISGDFRRAAVAALRAQGLTMEEIAELFGVTRQRISAIIKSDTTG